jgi:hypothetical protein
VRVSSGVMKFTAVACSVNRSGDPPDGATLHTSIASVGSNPLAK